MSALGRFCCRSLLQVFLVSDSVAVMRFATGAGHDGAAQSRAGTVGVPAIFQSFVDFAEAARHAPGRIKGRSGAARRFRRIREAIGRSIGHREAGHIGACREVARIAACREVSRIAVWEAVVRIAGCLGLIRSRDHQRTARRRQPPDPHNHAHKMRRESQLFRQMRK